jgi:hypothetical protein
MRGRDGDKCSQLRCVSRTLLSSSESESVSPPRHYENRGSKKPSLEHTGFPILVHKTRCTHAGAVKRCVEESPGDAASLCSLFTVHRSTDQTTSIWTWRFIDHHQLQGRSKALSMHSGISRTTNHRTHRCRPKLTSSITNFSVSCSTLPNDLIRPTTTSFFSANAADTPKTNPASLTSSRSAASLAVVVVAAVGNVVDDAGGYRERRRRSGVGSVGGMGGREWRRW